MGKGKKRDKPRFLNSKLPSEMNNARVVDQQGEEEREKDEKPQYENISTSNAIPKEQSTHGTHMDSKCKMAGTVTSKTTTQKTIKWVNVESATRIQPIITHDCIYHTRTHRHLTGSIRMAGA